MVRELYRIFDINKAEFDDRYDSFLSLIHPDDKQLVQQTNRRAIESGEPFNFEYRIVTRNGQLKHIQEVGYAIKDVTGKVNGLFGTAQDISETKRS